MQGCDLGNTNVKAFLKLLRWLENFPNDGDATYTTMYGGRSFNDLSKHPNVTNTHWGRSSTAAGAYMFLYGTWGEAVEKGVVSDFTPAGQDALAWWKIGRRDARAEVCGGRKTLEQAFAKLRSEWASLPGAGQNQVSLATAKARYETYLAEFSAPALGKKP